MLMTFTGEAMWKKTQLHLKRGFQYNVRGRLERNVNPGHTVEQGPRHVEYRLQNVLKRGQASNEDENYLSH